MGPIPPVLVGCGDKTRPNLMTVAWTGILNSKPPITYVSIRPERYSHDIIEKTGEFTINLVNAKLLRALDGCGIKSGRDIDKFSAYKLTPQYDKGFSAPYVEQCPISLLCSVTQIIRLPSHDMFMAEIKKVIVDDQLLDNKGALKIERADLVGFAHGQYFTTGKRLGSFGYSVRKKS